MNGILGWLNENGLSYYPMSKDLIVSDLIIDANFVQFDGFIPILETIEVKPNKIILHIQIDTGLVLVEILDSYTKGTGVKIYQDTRYIGIVVVGTGYDTLKRLAINKVLTVNVPFLDIVVRSIPLAAGVFSIEGLTGALTFTKDDTIHFAKTGNTIEWSAVALATPPSSVVPLKSINLIAPEANNINIYDSDLIKITPGIGTVTFNLANSDLSSSINPSKNFS